MTEINPFLWLQVGKGLSKDEKAHMLALQHWLEAVSFLFDPGNAECSCVMPLRSYDISLDVA